MFLISFIAATIVISLSVCISVIITQPFTGALVRLRANYLPKAVSLDNVLEDGGADEGGLRGTTSGVTPRKISAYFLNQRRQSAKIGPVVSGVFPMLFRTKNLEGWAGVYKGSFPVALQLVVLAFLTSLIFDVDGHSRAGAGGTYKAAPSGPGQFGFFGNLFFMVLVSLVALPLNVITYRAIVHPRTLPLSPAAIRENLHELLSPAEITQPWRLYLIPGLLPVTFAHIAWVGLLTRAVRHILVPNLGGLPEPTPANPGDTDYSGPNSSMKEVNPLWLAIYLGWNAFSVVALSPLEVVTVRLATQRPERQQPLHLAYARLSSGAPAPYSHQASVQRSGGPTGGGFSDDGPGIQDYAGAAAKSDKPLPSEPPSGDAGGSAGSDEPASRPSFAIEDEDDDDEPNKAKDPLLSPSSQTHAEGTSTPTPSAPHRSLGPGPGPGPQQPHHPSSQSIPDPPAPHLRHGHSANARLGFEEPPEPVIALRPVEEEGAGAGAADVATVQRYDGLRDCLDKVVEEEGVEALYRGAWVTGLGALIGGLN